MTANNSQCGICIKNKATSRCIGCLRDFCSDHFIEHRQQLSKELDQIEQERDLFQEIINLRKDSLIQQIDQWKHESIEKIKEIVEETKELLSIHINEKIINTQLFELAEDLRNSREKEDTIEEDLQQWKEQLEQLTQQMNTSSKIIVVQTEIPLVKRIQIQLPVISSKAKWMQNGITVAGGNGLGNEIHQLSCPYSLCLDDDQNIYVADYMNHRIVQWKKGARIGQVVAGVQGQGNRNGQLSYPTNVVVDKKNNSLIICDYGNRRVLRWPCENTKAGETIISDMYCWGLAMDSDEYLYVSNDQKHEVRRWKMGEHVGTLVAGGNGQGDRLDQLNRPYHIFVDQDQSVYISDYGNHRVMKWVKDAREGVVVAGGQGQGNGLRQLFNPVGIMIDQSSTLYVADLRNHRVMRWLKGATEGSIVVGGNGLGKQTNQLNHPWYLSFDQQNNLYVADFGNYRIQKFPMEKF